MQESTFVFWSILLYVWMFGKCQICNFTKNEIIHMWRTDYKLKNIPKTQVIYSGGTHKQYNYVAGTYP